MSIYKPCKRCKCQQNFNEMHLFNLCELNTPNHSIHLSILTHFLVVDVVNFQVIKMELFANENYKELFNTQSKLKQII